MLRGLPAWGQRKEESRKDAHLHHALPQALPQLRQPGRVRGQPGSLRDVLLDCSTAGQAAGQMPSVRPGGVWCSTPSPGAFPAAEGSSGPLPTGPHGSGAKDHGCRA